MSERLGYTPPEAQGGAEGRPQNGRVSVLERPIGATPAEFSPVEQQPPAQIDWRTALKVYGPDYFMQPEVSTNGHSANGQNGHVETNGAAPTNGTAEIGSLAAGQEIIFGDEGDYASDFTDAQRPQVMKGAAREARRQYEREWNKGKKTRRLGGYAMAQGFIHTGSGVQYYDRGVAKPNQKKMRGNGF